jgi:hypothetical protein
MKRWPQHDTDHDARAPADQKTYANLVDRDAKVAVEIRTHEHFAPSRSRQHHVAKHTRRRPDPHAARMTTMIAIRSVHTQRA